VIAKLLVANRGEIARRVLRAAGNFSGPVGPSWSGVRRGRAS